MRTFFETKRARYGGGLLRFLLSVIIVAVLIYVAWVTYSNWLRGGGVDPRAALDPSVRQAAHEDARPHLEAVTRSLRELSEATFGDGGYIDQASAWRRRARQAAPIAEAVQQASQDSASPGQEAPGLEPSPSRPAQRSPATLRMESQILEAEEKFQQALESYHAADPSQGGWTPERRQAVRTARQGFSEVRDHLSSGGAQLYDVIESYAQQDDHNPQVLRQARSMMQHNQRLLSNANRMSSSF